MEPSKSDQPDNACAICVASELTTPTRCEPCGHRFCHICISIWVNTKSSTCPTCRAQVVSLEHTVIEVVRPVERRQQEASLEFIRPADQEEDEPHSFFSVDEQMIQDALGDGEFRADEQEEDDESSDSYDMSIDSDSDSDSSAIYDLHPEFSVTIGSCRSSRAAVDFSKRPWDETCENCKLGHACSKHDLAGHFTLQVPFPMYAPIALMEWNKFNGTANTIVERAEQIHRVLTEKRREKVADSDEFLAHGYITRGLLNMCAKAHPFVFVRVASKLPPGPIGE